MPRLRFILLRCGCGSEYKIRIDRIAEGTAFECVSCGASIPVAGYAELMELAHRYSEMVLALERHAQVNGDVLIPKRQVEFS